VYAAILARTLIINFLLMSQLPFSDTKMRRCCWPGSKLFFKYASNTFRFFGVQQLHRSPRTLPFLAFPFSTSWTFQAVTLRRYSAPGRTNSTWDIHYRFWIPKWSFFRNFIRFLAWSEMLQVSGCLSSVIHLHSASVAVLA
jgi:hypothetical protein